MSMNFNNNKPTPPPATKPHNNNKLIAEIVIAVLLGTIGAVVIIHHVMSVQDAMDQAGLKFTKMDDGLLLSSIHSASSSPSPSSSKMTVMEMVDSCAAKIRDSGAEPTTVTISSCVGKELNK